jgi:hypothetical protein
MVLFQEQAQNSFLMDWKPVMQRSVIVCLSQIGFNYTGDLDCHPTLCGTINIPNCPEEDYEEEYEDEEGMRYRKKVEELQNEEIITYPNPANSTLTVEWKNVIEKTVVLKLLNQNSKVVSNKTKIVQGNKIELDINGYADGVYTLEIGVGEKVSRKKIVILK